VGVLDAQNEGPLVMPCVSPIKQCGPNPADLEIPRRAGRKPHTSLAHDLFLYEGLLERYYVLRGG